MGGVSGIDPALTLLASLLRPVDAPPGVVIVRTDDRWSVASTRGAAADTVVWGRSALPSGSRLSPAVVSAIHREIGLARTRIRPPDGLRLRAVYRLGPVRAGTGAIRRRIRRTVLGGAALELTRSPDEERVLDRVLSDAGLRSVSLLRPSSGGAGTLRGRDSRGRRVVVRLAPAGTSADPADAGQALRTLGAAALPHVPQLLDEGITLGISWTVETALPGRRPDRLTKALASGTAGLLATLPRGEGPPTSLAEDLAEIGRSAASRATRLAPLVALFGEPDLPAVVRHGDLWAGNLLHRWGRLTGIVDWDAWHPRGVPGADLLELYASGERLRARRPLGVVWAEQPWRDPAFSELSSGYADRLGLQPDDWDVVAVAWWAAKVAGTLRRLPTRGEDERWLAEVVDPVLERLPS